MEHVAAEANLARQTIYRYVSGRDELVELALLERCREFSLKLRPAKAPKPKDLRGAFVDLILAAVEIGREDAEFRYLTEALPQSRLSPVSTSPDSPMHGFVWDAFAPLIECGRAAELLRTEASDHDLVECLQGVIAFFAPRVDLDETAQRRRIRLFVLPALFR